MNEAPDTTEATTFTAKSFDEIAASMIVPRDEKQQPKEAKSVSDDADGPGRQRPNVSGEPAADRDDDLVSQDDTQDRDDDSNLPDVESEDGSQHSADADDNLVGEEGGQDDDPLFSDLFTTEQERADDDPQGEPLDTSKLGDDITLSVTVDEEERQVTLGELKKRYAGEGAIEKRLQQATEVRNNVTQDYQKTRQLTEAMLKEFGQALFRRTVPAPNDALLDSNPTAYIKQKAMYDQESDALQGAHRKLHGMMQQMDAINEDAVNMQRQTAAADLRKIMPVFNDPVRGPKVRAAIVDAAGELGYSQAEIAACSDPRLFKTVALAARELKRQKGLKTSAAKPVSKSSPVKGTRNRKPATASQRKASEAAAIARKTGKVDDVAATMIEAAPKARRPRR